MIEKANAGSMIDHPNATRRSFITRLTPQTSILYEQIGDCYEKPACRRATGQGDACATGGLIACCGLMLSARHFRCRVVTMAATEPHMITPARFNCSVQPV